MNVIDTLTKGVDRVSHHNRERKWLWKIGLHKQQIGRKATHAEIQAVRANKPLRKKAQLRPRRKIML